MSKEIVINAEKDQTRIAIVENGELAEMYFEGPETQRTLGDIFLGRIRRVLPNIQAAFVDIGQKTDAFLHFSDLSDNLPLINEFLSAKTPEVGKTEIKAVPHKRVRRHRPQHGRRGSRSDRTPRGKDGQKSSGSRPTAEERHRRRSAQRRSSQGAGNKGKEKADKASAAQAAPLESHLKPGANLLVKIVKEPISNKGSRVSTDISLAGRFVVLVPLADYVAVSRRIQSFKERRRLRTLAKSLLPKGFGLIVRTVADGKNAKALDTDLRLLLDKWRRIEKKLQENPQPPTLLHEDVSMVSSIIRDLFSEEFEQIVIDNPRLHRNVKNYVHAVAPHVAPRVKLHKGSQHVFARAKIDKSVAEAFEPRVNLPSGGYLIIEHTEAMHVIDVNSGRAGKGLSQEENSLRVNLESARVLAKQLRLRDLGGIIVVDFIDLRDDRNRRKVHDELKKEFRKDRAVTKILPMSDFGLVQITRQRLRPSITTTADSSGNGKPEIEEKSVETAPTRPPAQKQTRRFETPAKVIRRMDQWIQRYRDAGKKAPLTLRVHPFTGAFLTRAVPSQLTKWKLKHRVRIRLVDDEDVDPMKFRFFDSSGTDVTFPRRSQKEGGPSRKQGDALRKEEETSRKQDEAAGSQDDAPRDDGAAPKARKPSNKRPQHRRPQHRKPTPKAQK